jgi:hypothetical protein
MFYAADGMYPLAVAPPIGIFYDTMVNLGERYYLLSQISYP